MLRQEHQKPFQEPYMRISLSFLKEYYDCHWRKHRPIREKDKVHAPGSQKDLH